MIARVLLFLLINFTALGIGGLSTRNGASSYWYESLNKAPWTPPGWVFGFAWTAIMIFFSIYMAYLWQQAENKKLLASIFALQWALNVAWNPIFFSLHQVALGLLVIGMLSIVVGFMLYFYWSLMTAKSALLFPYFIWLLIATSLNAYVVIMN